MNLTILKGRNFGDTMMILFLLKGCNSRYILMILSLLKGHNSGDIIMVGEMIVEGTLTVKKHKEYTRLSSKTVNISTFFKAPISETSESGPIRAESLFTHFLV